MSDPLLLAPGSPCPECSTPLERYAGTLLGRTEDLARIEA